MKNIAEFIMDCIDGGGSVASKIVPSSMKMHNEMFKKDIDNQFFIAIWNPINAKILSVVNTIGKDI